MADIDFIIELIKYGTSLSPSITTVGTIISEYGIQGGLVSTTIGGIMVAAGESSDPDIIVRTEDNNDYIKTEQMAKQIYDKFHKGHDKDYKPTVLYLKKPEDAEKMLNLIDSFKSKEEMYIYLTALQRVIEEIIREENENKENLESNSEEENAQLELPKIRNLKK